MSGSDSVIVNRSTDERIAEKLFGWKWSEVRGERALISPYIENYGPLYHLPSRAIPTWSNVSSQLPYYSSDNDEAIKVTEVMAKKGVHVSMNLAPNSKEWAVSCQNWLRSSYSTNKKFAKAVCEAVLDYLDDVEEQNVNSRSNKSD